ncbi:MAG: hypothetical protein ABSB76_18865 [Streptosporangiaceae bacterium]
MALIAYVRHHHALWASGPLLAEVSIGSIAGSLLLGVRGSAGQVGQQYRRLPRLLLGYTGGLALLTAAALCPPLLGVAAPLAGFASGQPILALALATAVAAAAAASAVLTSVLRPPAAPQHPARHARDLGSHPGSFG